MKFTNADAKTVQDMLTLVSCRVTLKEIKSWSPERRERIEKWVSACHLRASDNNVRIPKRPRFKHRPLTLRGFHKQIRML